MMKHSQQLKSVVQLIDDTLADHDKLLVRTRVRRGNSVRGSAQEDVVEDGEVFDDTDFYQQLLRDVIDARGNGTNGAEDWMVVQRQKKAKKNVDTKASKGRKIR
jgi:protein AATF/BFR2